MSEKLQKVLARAGLGSRREIETWIEDGRLMVNGYPALLGTRVEPKDEVKLDGRRLRLVPESLVNRKILMYHKPEGEVTTRKDPEGRPTVFDRLPPMRGSRWVAIGRLDLNTSGLLLFTNDGEMANRLMHPSHEVEREYAVRILGELKPSQRKQLLEGVVLEDGLAKFNSIESRGGSGTNRWYHVTLSEGRTREVRRMFESLQLVVSRLIRVRYGPVSLDPLLKQGMNRLLTLDETNRLSEAVGVEPQAPRAERRREYQQTRRSEPLRGRGDMDDEFADEAAAPVSARKPRVIGSKADDLPLDRVERAAELLRRRREAESAGVEFSGRSGRLSGKRTLRESELRKIAEEKAAAKAKRGAGKSGAASEGGDREAPRTRATGTRTRSAASSATERSRPAAPGARSAASRIASTRNTSTRTGLARSTSYAERDEDDVAPRRAPRAGARVSRGSEEESPRRRSAAKPAGARSASSVRSSRSEDSERPSRRRMADGDRPARSRAGSASSERTGRATGTRSSGRAGAGAASRSADTARGGTASRSTSAPRSASATRSKSSAKPASRSAAGASKPARGASSRASTAERGSSGRSSARPATSPRGGSRSGGGARPAGKGKRTR